MIDLIVKLEDMLKNSGYTDWEIIYVPEYEGYLLKLDGDAIFMSKVDGDADEFAR